MIIATWNVNSITVRIPHLTEWIAANKPNVLCLQETKVVDEKFPKSIFEGLGYAVEFCGEKTYNGTAIISDRPIQCVHRDLPGEPNPQSRRFMEVLVDDLYILNVYVPNGQSVGSEKYEYKLRWLTNLRRHLETSHNPDSKLVVLGDFNIAPEDLDVYSVVESKGSIMCSDEERAHLAQIKEWGLVDVYRQHVKDGGNFSWWDYRMNCFKRNLGFRIDHIWGTRAFSATTSRAWIDKAPRKLERPSDHAPVIVETMN